jgi:two-component system, chemotaxis family, CheB/CheR fusion protein
MSALNFPVVGIGASAGGIEAFHGFFKHMPADCGAAFVVLLHLPAERKSMLTDILSRWTTMRVVEGRDGIHLEPNCVYVPPPHALAVLDDGRLQISPSTPDAVYRPIDVFFDSLGAQQREKAVGIVLSGTGNDGSLGLKSLKGRGGLTLAQGTDGSAPQYPNMPEGAIASGAVDLVTSVEEMPEQLLRIWRASTTQTAAAPPEDIERLRLEICAILRERIGHDFSGYRSQTFLRRVERRMQVQNAATLTDYAQKLRESADEATMLFRDLLIRVTSFFRDQETFESLKSKVIPLLFADKRADATVRVWIPGCATGEEAYSIAMLLREYMDQIPDPPKVQIFATDIDEAAISTARLGRYPIGLLEGLSNERLERFFMPSQGSYVVAKDIRELCTFSIHNLVRDPPFSTMSLVSCRNLLIYMNPELQARVIPIFHYALVTNGVLLLGGAESVVQHGELFATIDKSARIFQRRVGRSPELNLSWHRSASALSRSSPPGIATASAIPSLHDGPGADGRAGSAKLPSVDTTSPATRYADLLGVLKPTASNVGQLQKALATVSEDFRSLAEQYQSALEELRSANEELHSVNEEMQSTNEELETSKEELQSLNEELHTVNLRLTEKISELDRTNSDLRNLFESTEIATVFLDRHLLIRSFTPAIATLYNLIPSDQGRPLTDIVSRLQYDNLREDVDAVLSSREPLERRVARADRAMHYIMRILPYRDPDSTVSGVLITFIDVTSIVQAENALRQADVRKDLFLATLSHELRNPLAPVRTAAQILTSPKLQPEELGRVQAIISRQVGHMSSLLDDLLDVSRITRGAFTLKKGYVKLADIIEEAVEAAQPAIDRRGHTLRIDRPSQEISLEADPVRMTQILTNLLTNAAKYTPKGGEIKVGTRMEANSLVLYVRDNGVGLSPEMLGKVFDMFTQVEAQKARAEGGLGIGLALVKGLVELHGGRIEARSAGLNQGSEFVVTLPRAMVVEGDESRAADTNGSAAVAKKVLIVDDHSDGADMLKVLLSQAGHDVHVAHSGLEAFDLARQLRPQIVLMDISMPGMNGYEAAERIRREAWGQQIKLVAMTGWGNEEDRRRAMTAGFDVHMTKPVDPEALRQFIEGGRAS